MFLTSPFHVHMLTKTLCIHLRDNLETVPVWKGMMIYYVHVHGIL